MQGYVTIMRLPSDCGIACINPTLAFLELHVTQSGGASCGADKGLADVRAAGFGPLAGLHEVGECWELSVVAEL